MPARRHAALGLLLLHLQACTTWAAHKAPVPEAFAGEPPPEVRVTLHDGQRIVLRGPVVSADSLLGIEVIEVPQSAGPPRQRRVAVGLDQVAQLETRRGSNAAIALVTIPVTFAVVYFLVGSVWRDNVMGN